MRESCCDISSSLNSHSSEEKFEAQNIENEGSLGYKLYKTISFLSSTSFLIQPKFLNFLTTTCGIKSNHRMKAKGESMERSLALAMNPFLLCHELSFKELNFVVRKPSWVSTLSFSFQGIHVVAIYGKKMNGSW
ncbi:hypothetical protein M9H77_23250 [Catharanthus roseus]|uniref:Uncharacterized protein n=1 Tax=Catharanthus roseus TaxID=4058 RepID=A0ACC0ASE4_CATRO|nr:hypothetical protein M9H77_23250 [Catharanthus roseus]